MVRFVIVCRYIHVKPTAKKCKRGGLHTRVASKIDEYYKTFQKIDNGRNVKTPYPLTRFVEYEKGTTDEEAKEAGFDQEAPPFDPRKVVIGDDDPSKLDFQFETGEQGRTSSFLSKMKGAFQGHLSIISGWKRFFKGAKADEERASGSVDLPSNERRRRDVVRRIIALMAWRCLRDSTVPIDTGRYRSAGRRLVLRYEGLYLRRDDGLVAGALWSVRGFVR